MARYVIKENTEAESDLRGAARQVWLNREVEAMIAGPSETGKTYACLYKLNCLLWKYKGSQANIVRLTNKSIHGSVLQTYKKLIGKNSPIKAYGGEHPEWYDYPNGSRLWLVGMDSADKVLSSERDFIYVNQAEELSKNHWEYLLTRCTGRAGNAPYSQLLGDCNPGPHTHWILKRFGPRLMESRHEDNPTLFFANGTISDQGVRTIDALDRLTGVTKERLRYGRWVSAEGVIYPNFSIAHQLKRSEVPQLVDRYEVIDFGYTHPFCWQNWGVDNDGRMYLTHEIYYTQRTVAKHCELINRLTKGWRKPRKILADWDAEDRATFRHERGIITFAANKEVKPGIARCSERLNKRGDGKYGVYFCEDALVELDSRLVSESKPTCTIDEFGSYVWDEAKDMPIKENDHGMDPWRYQVNLLDFKMASNRQRVGSFSYAHTG